jgi:hypothetical protein
MFSKPMDSALPSPAKYSSMDFSFLLLFFFLKNSINHGPDYHAAMP